MAASLNTFPPIRPPIVPPRMAPPAVKTSRIGTEKSSWIMPLSFPLLLERPITVSKAPAPAPYRIMGTVLDFVTLRIMGTVLDFVTLYNCSWFNSAENSHGRDNPALTPELVSRRVWGKVRIFLQKPSRQLFLAETARLQSSVYRSRAPDCIITSTVPQAIPSLKPSKYKHSSQFSYPIFLIAPNA